LNLSLLKQAARKLHEYQQTGKIKN
jgi:hypothetical protein